MRLAEFVQLGTSLPVFVNPDQVVCVAPHGDHNGTAITTTAKANGPEVILVAQDLSTTVGKLEGIL